MAGVYDYSTTAGSNTTVGGVSIAEGMAPGNVNNGMRAMMADTRKWQLDWSGITTAGTGNAYTITSNQGVAAYADGMRFSFRADRANTGAATLNVDGRGAKALRKVSNTALAALAADDIVVGAVYDVVYLSGDDVFVIVGFAGLQASAFAQTLLDDADQAAAQATLGVVPGTNVQAYNANLASLSGLTLAAGDLLYATGPDTLIKLGIGTPGQLLQTNSGATAPEWTAPPGWTFLAPVSTSSGTASDATGIPSTAREILIVLKGVSVSGVEDVLVRLGTSSGFEATGYVSDASYGGGTITGATGFAMRVNGAARALRGFMHLVHIGGNEWCESHSAGYSHGGGAKTLADVLTRIRLLPTGADTFDAGEFQVGYR